MTAEEYVEKRLDDQIRWYDSKSATNKAWFGALRVAEIVGAAAIPLLAVYIDPDRPLVTGSVASLGAAVAVIAGVLGLFQFENRWVEYRRTCESLRREKFLFLSGAEPFGRESGPNYHLLVQRVEAALSRENANWAEYTMQSVSDQGASESP